MSDIEYSVIKSDVIKSFDCIGTDSEWQHGMIYLLTCSTRKCLDRLEQNSRHQLYEAIGKRYH